MDILFQSIGYISLLVVLVLLWRKAFRQSEFRQFPQHSGRVWWVLAVAWTMNLFGNIAWIVHDLVTGTQLDTLSVVDLFYVFRYVLISYVLWMYPLPLPRRNGLWIGITMLAAGMVVWAVYFDPAMVLRGGDWVGFLGLALYPILDVCIVLLAWLRVQSTRGTTWGMYAFLLFCAMASYGIANTINLTEYVFSLTSSGIGQAMFWILTDIFVLVMVLKVDLQNDTKSLIRNEE